MIIFIIVLQIIISFLTYEQTLTFDEAIWQYIGRNWIRHGLVPYSGGVDNKSPLVFAVYGLSDKLFGVNYWFPRLLGICFQSIGLYYVYKIGRHVASARTGFLALTLYGFSILWHSTGGKFVSYTESYAVVFIIMAIYYIISAEQNYSYFLSGILAGLGFMFRISAFFGLLAILTYLLLMKKNKIFIFLIGLLGSVFIIGTLLSLAGIRLHDIFIFALSDNFGPGSVTDHSLSWKLNNFFNHFFYSELVLFSPGLIGYFFIKKKNDIFLLWFICEFIGILIPGIFSLQHVKSLLPSLSLMSAFSIAWLLEIYSLPLRQTMIVVWICFFPKLVEPIVSFKNLVGFPKKDTIDEKSDWNIQEGDYTKKLLGLWIKSNTVPDTRVFIAGFAAIAQAYSERRSPSIYFNVTQTQLAKKIFFKEMNLNKPEMICVPAFPGYYVNVDPDIRSFINQMTGLQYDLKRNMYGYSIYLKKNSPK